jgi:ABC-2 type transport system permease protein
VTRVGDVVRVLRYAVLTGYYDYQTIYTWRTWLVGWYLRVLSQVAFFALIGKLLHSPARTHYLLVGNAMLLAAMGSLVAVASTQWERWAGTMPLLVAAPSSHVVVFAGRSLAFVADAVLTSLGAFFAAAAMFGLPLPWPRVVLLPLLVVSIAIATYALAIFLGGCALRAPGARNVVSNLAQTTMMALAGVNVPVAFYPGPVHVLSYAFPLTFGLRAVRGLLGGAGAGSVAAEVALQLAAALGWLVLALVTFDRFGERGRRTGTIDFA